MTTLNKEIYEAFQATGIDDTKAKAAAASVYEKEQIATKVDIAELRTDIAELKAEIQAMINRLLLSLIAVIVGSMVAMTGIFAAIVKWPWR